LYRQRLNYDSAPGVMWTNSTGTVMIIAYLLIAL
jgi:hypothetical protein